MRVDAAVHPGALPKRGPVAAQRVAIARPVAQALHFLSLEACIPCPGKVTHGRHGGRIEEVGT
jgi:hypothetical protein